MAIEFTVSGLAVIIVNFFKGLEERNLVYLFENKNCR